MKLTVTTKVNERHSLVAEIDGKMDECLRGVNALLAYDGKCGLCGGEEVSLQTKMAKGYSFIEYVCHKCYAKAQWGQYKEGGYFLKKWEQYQPTQQAETPTQPTSQGGGTELPF